jgi:hypothetical protein
VKFSCDITINAKNFVKRKPYNLFFKNTFLPKIMSIWAQSIFLNVTHFLPTYLKILNEYEYYS